MKKGYTLTVVSWENDGDNYNTKTKTVQTKGEAKVWYDMMMLCRSKNNKNKGGLGNTYDGFNSEQETIAANFIKANHKTLLTHDDIDNDEDDTLADYFCDLAGELLGYGEDCKCRVMESCVVTYSDKDIEPEIITF